MIIDKFLLTFDNIRGIMMMRGVNMKKSKIAKIVWIIFIILLVGGVGCLFFLPSLYDFFKESIVSSFKSHSIYYQIAFYICYIICLILIYELMILFRQVYNGSPFKKQVVSTLNVSSILFMMLSIIVMIKTFLIPTLLSFVVAVIV